MKTNVSRPSVTTHEGGIAQSVSPYLELRRTLLTCLLFEDTFYEKGSDLAKRIADLVPQVPPQKVADLAIEARDKMQLRHAPLFLILELARIKGNGSLVASTLAHVIQRADELAEFLALYWRNGRQYVSHGVQRGLAAAFTKFNEYQLAKYNREGAVKLRDALFLCHAKPKDAEQAALWKKLIEGQLQTPDTWEVELSAGKDKKETFERLLREKKLGGLATLRNLRNMISVGVSESLIRERLSEGIKRALPFRFIAAARYAPSLEPDIELAMFKAAEGLEKLPGVTGLLVDVSGSMDDILSGKSEMKRLDAACGLAIYLREKGDQIKVATFSQQVIECPARRGFALRDAIVQSQPHGGTWLRAAVDSLRTYWGSKIDRFIVITDEQSHDGNSQGWTAKNYLINVAPYKHGVSYGDNWIHIDGWSERIIDYIRLCEA